MDIHNIHISKSKLKYLFFGLLFIALVSFTFVIKPLNYGDGSEYNIMTEGFKNRISPKFVESDVKKLNELSEKFDYDDKIFTEEYAKSGYFESIDNEYYSYHFWAYSLLHFPISFILDILGLNIFASFQIVNVLALFALIYYVYKLSPGNKFFNIAIIIINSSLWYIHWNHPEYISYVLVTIGLLLFYRNNLLLSLLLLSLAAMQNSPIMFLIAPIVLLRLLRLDNINFVKEKDYKNTFKELFKIFLVCLPLTFPYIFYLWKFGHPNLIMSVGMSDFSLVSLKRVFELFFDPNIGTLFYSPLPVIGITLMFFYSLYSLKNNNFKEAKYLLLLFGLFIGLLTSTSTTNWNHGSTGHSRYVMWSILPLGNFFVVYLSAKYLKNIKDRKQLILKLFFAVFVLYQLAIVLVAGGVVPNGRFGSSGFNIFSRVIIERFPESYNPSPQIFSGRIYCEEDNCIKNTYIYRNDKCVKAVSSDLDAVANIKQICGESIEIKKGACIENSCYYTIK